MSLAVLLVHGWVADRVERSRIGWGASDNAVQRMDVAFVRELKPSAPPVAAPRPATPRRAAPQARTAPPSHAASSPAVPEDPPSWVPPQDAPAPEAMAAADAAASAALPAEAAASKPANVAYDWPPSSRLNYAVTGSVNGPVEGSARVQWIRDGSHYQVQMDTRVALIATRRMTSDGELTEQGLRPRRYDEETQVAFGTPRRAAMLFDDDRILLANGRSVARPSGVQDTASQLVQLVWLFTTHPERLVPGQQVELPLALPWRVDDWVFDVLATEAVSTPFGEVPAVHVKPRRPARPGNVLTVECWFAPTLQYLPVRIRVQQNEQTYLDLLLESPPLQAEPR